MLTLLLYYFSFDNLNIKQWEAWVRAGNVTVIYKNEDYYFFLLLFFTFLYRKFLSRDRYITHSVHNVWSYLRFIMIIIYHNLLILFVVNSVGTSVLKNLQSINRIMWTHPCHCIIRCHIGLKDLWHLLMHLLMQDRKDNITITSMVDTCRLVIDKPFVEPQFFAFLFIYCF